MALGLQFSVQFASPQDREKPNGIEVWCKVARGATSYLSMIC
jgi:hypothetical protein